jgi:long-chain acyl-CoA synthetase
MGALCDPMAWTTDAHGDIPACIEVKLVDFPEAGYYSTNKPHAQGEIWIRGESVPEGYYQNDKETSEAMAAGGWFKTGDIGEWVENGHLKIIDRKKNLVKTLNGEYIALEKVWCQYSSKITADIYSLNLCIALQRLLQTSVSMHRSMRPTPLQLLYRPSRH